jgi:hypothetical protein
VKCKHGSGNLPTSVKPVLIYKLRQIFCVFLKKNVECKSIEWAQGISSGATSVCVCTDKKRAPAARRKTSAVSVLTQIWTKYAAGMRLCGRVRASVRVRLGCMQPSLSSFNHAVIPSHTNRISPPLFSLITHAVK